jgi:ribosomal protein L11 methyltransferase
MALDAYFGDRPDRALIEAVHALVPSAATARPRLEKLADQDWVTMSQTGLEPIRAGRFFVHTPAYRTRCRRTR